MMGDRSTIEWTDATWNPIVGCSVVSPGCTNCYAMRQAHRIKKMDEARTGRPDASHYFGTTQIVNSQPVWTGTVAQAPEHIWDMPLRWKRPRRIFVNSMSDLFHPSVPDAWIDRVFASAALAPQHTFQVLTKRSARMRAYMTAVETPARIALAAPSVPQIGRDVMIFHATWPLPNVWVGVSAEDQRRADERVPDLLATPAAVRWVSAEPLLSGIDFTRIEVQHDGQLNALTGQWASWPMFERGGQTLLRREARRPALDWIVVGGESGPAARPMHPRWARDIRDHCAAAGVAFHFKQWGAMVPGELAPPVAGSEFIPWRRYPDGRERWDFGEFGKDRADMPRVTFMHTGKKRAGRMLDGRTHDDFPFA